MIARPCNHDGVVPALLSGGDSRIRVDAATGTNKYLCPPRPASGIVGFASCTASPIWHRSFEQSSQAFDDIMGAASPRVRAERLALHRHRAEARLLRHFGATGLAKAILCPSGTDALLTAAMLVAAERPGTPVRAILPCAAETGAGVPLAAACRQFDGPGSGTSLADVAVSTVEIPLRNPVGEPRSEDDLNDAYAIAAALSAERAVVYLTYGTKTGLIAPVAPQGTDVIVDACQGRIAPEVVAACLRRGWPVVVTGSKFLGGPAFSGAVLFPRARLNARRSRPVCGGVGLGTVLRWTAAVAVIEAFARRSAGMAPLLHDIAAVVHRGLRSIPAAVPIDGLQPRGPAWADLPSIFTFAVRDPEAPARLLSAAGLRPLHQLLARQGVLLGQPVDLGAFGGLRIAVGARDLLETEQESRFACLFDTLAAAIAVPPVRGAASRRQAFGLPAADSSAA